MFENCYEYVLFKSHLCKGPAEEQSWVYAVIIYWYSIHVWMSVDIDDSQINSYWITIPPKENFFST